MVFNDPTLSGIIFIGLTLWVLGLTVVVARMVGHYNKLTGGAKNLGLKEILERLLAGEKNLRGETQELFRLLDALKADGRLHIQRVGMVRFNPFSDTGGNQSFTLALLDGHDNGLVMTSLYARSGHRWYIKEVAGGKGRELALSHEEASAVQKAKPLAGTTK